MSTTLELKRPRLFVTGRRYVRGWWVVKGPDPKVIRLVKVVRPYGNSPIGGGAA